MYGFIRTKAMVMIQSAYFPQRALDQWLEEAKIDLSAKEWLSRRKIGGYHVL